MPFRTDDENLLVEKYKAIWTKIKDFKNIKLNAFPVYDGRRWYRMQIFYCHFY